MKIDLHKEFHLLINLNFILLLAKTSAGSNIIKPDINLIPKRFQVII